MINRRCYKEKLLGHIWKRYSEYLNELRNGSYQNIQIKRLSIDDIVFLKEENVPRQLWKFGKIEELIYKNVNLSEWLDIAYLTGYSVEVFSIFVPLR